MKRCFPIARSSSSRRTIRSSAASTSSTAIRRSPASARSSPGRTWEKGGFVAAPAHDPRRHRPADGVHQLEHRHGRRLGVVERRRTIPATSSTPRWPTAWASTKSSTPSRIEGRLTIQWIRRLQTDASARKGRGRPRADSRRAAQGHRRPGRGRRAGADRAVHRRPLPDHRRARPGEDAADQDARRHPRSRLQADPVHARPDAVGHHRHRDPRRGAGHAPAAVREGADLRADHPGRRDQPHAAEDAGGAARGDAGVSRHRRRPDLSARAAVLRARDAEPDRARRHLSAARSAARSLHVQRRHHLPERRRRGGGGDADDRRGAADAGAGAERRRHPAVPGARAAGRDRRGDRALRRAAGRRVAARAAGRARFHRQVGEVGRRPARRRRRWCAAARRAR